MKNKKNNQFAIKTLHLFIVFFGLVILGNAILNFKLIYLVCLIPLVIVFILTDCTWQQALIIVIIWGIFCLMCLLVKQNLSLRTMNTAINKVFTNFYAVRTKVISYVKNQYNKDTGEYINLLLFNWKEKGSEIYELNKQLAIVHLVVVSGLHINTLFAIIDKTIFYKLKNKTYKHASKVLLCFVYAYFLAYAISIIRILINSLLKTIFKKMEAKNVNYYSGIIVLFLLKNEAINYGFLMSYMCTIGIIVLISLKVNKLTLNILINCFCILITLPLVIKMNGKINIFAFFYNYLYYPIIIFHYLWFLLFAWWQSFYEINIFFTSSLITLMKMNLDLSIFIYVKTWQNWVTATYYLAFLTLFAIVIHQKESNLIFKSGF